MLRGLNIIVSEHALQETTERLFPESRHRSRRIRKKLIKRFGGEFKKTPCAFRTFHGIIMHPTLYHQLEKEIPISRSERPERNPLLGDFVTPSPLFRHSAPLFGPVASAKMLLDIPA